MRKKMDREKEIRLLMYEKSLIIKETKKEIKYLDMELKQLQGEKRLNKNNRRKK